MAHPLAKYHFIDTQQLNRLVGRLESALAECEAETLVMIRRLSCTMHTLLGMLQAQFVPL